MNEAQRNAMWKQIADGPAGWVIRMREQHGATFKVDERSGELIWTGCKCDGIYCPGAPIWLAHIDDLKEAIEQKQQQFAQETLRASKAESDLDAALAESRKRGEEVVALHSALEELIEVADLRGDSDLLPPSDDPKLWTARMIDAWSGGREALSNTFATAQETVQRIEREALEEAVDRVDAYVNQLHPPMGRAAAPLRAAILGEKKNG